MSGNTGFEVDGQKVVREFAYHYPRARQALVFERDADEVSFGAAFRSAGRSLLPLLRDNALLLSICGAADNPQIGPLFDWWLNNLRLAASYNRTGRAAFTASLGKKATSRSRVLDLLRAADLGLADMKVVKPDAETLDRLRRVAKTLQGDEEEGDEFVIEEQLQLIHRGAEGGVLFEPEDESMGTQVWVGLVGPVLDGKAHCGRGRASAARWLRARRQACERSSLVTNARTDLFSESADKSEQRCLAAVDRLQSNQGVAILKWLFPSKLKLDQARRHGQLRIYGATCWSGATKVRFFAHRVAC